MPTVMQWTLHLLGLIEKQKQYTKRFEARYRNEYVLPFLVREYREVYGTSADGLMSVIDPPKTGTAAIGIDALVERLSVLGATSDDAAAARLMQEAWEDNDLDVMHREAHREAFIGARSFGSAHRDTSGEKAIVGIESATQMAVHRQSAPPYDVDASLKVTVDEWTGKNIGLLRLPGVDLDMVELDAPVLDPEEPFSGRMSRWVPVNWDGTKTGLPGVPVVEFASRARLLSEPISEIEPIESLVDLSDLIEGLMVFAGHFGAVPITYATGLAVPRDPSDPTGQTPLLGPDGRPLIGFKPRADHFWMSTDKDTRFGKLEPAGLASFVTWAEHLSSRIRAKTSVASTYYSLDLKSHMSAELLKTDEAPMVRRVLSMGRDGSFGQSWRRLQRYMLMIEDPTSKARVKPRWADPETRVEAQATDSAQKLIASGYGIAAVGEKILGWDPELIARAVAEGEAMKAREADMQAQGDAAIERMARNLIPVPDLDVA